MAHLRISMKKVMQKLGAKIVILILFAYLMIQIDSAVTFFFCRQIRVPIRTFNWHAKWIRKVVILTHQMLVL